MKIRRSFLSVLMSAIIMLYSAAVFGATAGNVNNDTSVDLKDVIMLLQVCAGLTPAGVSTGGDVNSNGKIGLEEAIYALQIVAQLRTPENLTVWYKDADGDGVSDGKTILSATKPSDIYYKESELFAIAGDTDDNNSSVHPQIPSESEIIKANIEKKQAQWVAAPTPFFSKEDLKKRLGAFLPDPADAARQTRYSSKLHKRSEFPHSFDWRNSNGNYVTPVKDQGNCGSCWAFSTTAALESQMLLISSQNNLNIDLSEQIVLSCSGRGSCGGGFVTLVPNFLTSIGTNIESCYPYMAMDLSCDGACSNWQDTAYKIDSWSFATLDTPTVDDIKKALYETGPLVGMFCVFRDLGSYRSGVYSYVWGDFLGWHAILIVGWDDASSSFIVKNSWGTYFGESGYFRIAYSELNGETMFGVYTMDYHTDRPCPYNIDPSEQYFSPAGGNGTISITTSRKCDWKATSNNDCLTITSDNTGNKNGTVAYSVSPNPGTNLRYGSITIAGKNFTVAQFGISLNPRGDSFTAEGGNGNVSVTIANESDWTAKSNNSWITITSGANGKGNGAFSYSVLPNPTTDHRTGTITIA